MVQHVEDLTRREAQCCAFLTIETSRGGGEMKVVITSVNPDAGPVIDMIAGLHA